MNPNEGVPAETREGQSDGLSGLRLAGRALGGSSALEASPGDTDSLSIIWHWLRASTVPSGQLRFDMISATDRIICSAKKYVLRLHAWSPPVLRRRFICARSHKSGCAGRNSGRSRRLLCGETITQGYEKLTTVMESIG